MEELASSLDSKLVKMELFIRKLQLIEAYEQPTDIVNHFKESFEVIPDTHASYLSLLFKYYRALKSINDSDSISKIQNELSHDPRKIFQIYGLLIDLNGNGDVDVYQKLLQSCESFCNFSDYYLILLDFYNQNERLLELKELATNLLDQVMLKEYMPSDPFFLQYLYAYLSVVTGQSGDKSTSVELKSLALNGMSNSLNKFNELKGIIDSKG